MKNILKQERGVSLVSLAAAIIVIGIIVTMLLYSVKDTKDVKNLTDLYSDIDNITDKISNYYSVYGKIPAKEKTGLNALIAANWGITESDLTSGTITNEEGDPRGANDTGAFAIIDLSAIDNLTLNYGKAYKTLFSKETLTSADDADLYIINKNSNNVFYLKGIQVEGVKYYTNKDKDTQKVDIKYVGGVKIPDGFTYKSGSKDDSTNLFTITDGTNEYVWANIQDKIYTLNSETTTVTKTGGSPITIVYGTSQDKYDLLLSVNEYGGFYLKSNGNILYHDATEKWSKTYDAEGFYQDLNGDTAYIPAGFQVSKLTSMNTINRGLVVRNASTLDEYVWIDVPDYVLENANTLDEIERALKTYASTYSEEGYEDTWYNGCGIATQEAYNTLRNKMYMSIKDNGGFYIGRYEIGIGTGNVAVSQRDKKPYTNVTVSQAQSLASAMNSGEYTTSLMFGIQWDLVCKFIEETGSKTYNEIAKDSSNWGNYNNSQFVVTSENAKKIVNNYWVSAEKGETKQKNTNMVYTTGASETNKVLNIYDLSGSFWEYTLERKISNNYSVLRGNYYGRAINTKMSKRAALEVSSGNDAFGFRVTLFK